jgi:hypothetical protein
MNAFHALSASRPVRRILRGSICCTVALGLAALRAQPTLPPADPAWGKASDNKIYAQKLVNDIMATHPDLLSVALHATRPGGTIPEIVAHVQDLIGKKDSEEDLSVIKQDLTVIGPEMVEHTTQMIPRMVVHTALRDSAGAIIGMAVFSFKDGPGVDKLTVHTRAARMVDQLARDIPNSAALFKLNR